MHEMYLMQVLAVYVAVVLPAAAGSPPEACQMRVDQWCNNKTNNPSVTRNTNCGPTHDQKFYARRANASSAYGPTRAGPPAWRCYGASALTGPDHAVYDGTSKCYSSETAELLWQLCACNVGSSGNTSSCGAMPKPRGFAPVRPVPPPPLPPGPPISSIPLFVPCEDNRTGFRIPALLAVGETTLYAFAESRTGNGDGDYARHPCPGDNRTAIVFKTSTE